MTYELPKELNREYIRAKIVEFLKKQKPPSDNRWNSPSIQMNYIYGLFQDDIKTNGIPGYAQPTFLKIADEIISEFVNNGLLFFGNPGSANGYPWITITEYGKEVFESENWLPYDPEGYLKALKESVPEIDDVTFTYIGEAISAYNRRQLLSATLTLGVASENLMLLLIEAYLKWLKGERASALNKKVEGYGIYTQYKEFREEFKKDVKSLSDNLRRDWEAYLEGIFNFIRLNRNGAGHPTGKRMEAKAVNANLQMFADYARFMFDLIEFFS